MHTVVPATGHPYADDEHSSSRRGPRLGTWLLVAFLAALGLTLIDTSPSAGTYHGELPPEEPENGYWMIGRDGKRDVGILLTELDSPSDIRPDQTVGQEDIAGASRDQHFGFGKCRRLVLGNALRHLQLDDLPHLVRLAVRSQPRRIAGDREHLGQVLPQHVAENDEPRRDDFGRVRDLVFGVHGLSMTVLIA